MSPHAGYKKVVGMAGSAARQLQSFPRKAHQSVPQPLPCVFQGGQVVHRLSSTHQRNLQLLVVFLGLRWVVDRVDDLLQCRPGRFVATQRGLAAPAGGLVLAAFGHGPAVHLDQFVDHARGRGHRSR